LRRHPDGGPVGVRRPRQFVTGVLLVPSVVGLVWFAVLGGAGIAAQRDVGSPIPDAGARVPDGGR
jgi:choline-glycine betaine transporter